MWNKIKKHIGNYYTFRLDGIIKSGFFCGIGEINNNYGMVFLISDNSEKISSICCLFVHPLKIKCTLHNNNILKLRKVCRKYFEKHNMTNNLDNIYSPAFKIKEINKKDVKCK